MVEENDGRVVGTAGTRGRVGRQRWPDAPPRLGRRLTQSHQDCLRLGQGSGGSLGLKTVNSVLYLSGLSPFIPSRTGEQTFIHFTEMVRFWFDIRKRKGHQNS